MANDSGIVNIHGKSYQTVALRVQKFREAHKDFSLTTELVSRDEDCVVMKATIANEQGRVLATGHSEEYRASSQINKTSALENAETSAIGRALAALGLAGTEFASADEVANAIHQQKNPKPLSVAGEAWEALDEDEKRFLQNIADQVRSILENEGPAEAMKHLEAQKLDSDEKVCIWSRFSSAERSAMKKVNERKVA